MATSQTELIGRDKELCALADFLRAKDALPAAVLLEGEAGIGKTTLWKASFAGASDGG